jgi:phage-related protein
MQIHIEDEVQKFIESLETQAIAKTLRTVDLLERFGNKLTMPHSKQVSGGLYELRMRGLQEVRIFYCFHNGAICLLHGFIKKSSKTPNKELRLAQAKRRALTTL